MKITNLYTLSQFVDYLDSIQVALFMQWQYVKKYNDFLKQPLTKEMFVNEIEKPDKKEYGNFTSHPYLTENELYELALETWQEAENKVIFEGASLRLFGKTTMIDIDYLDVFIEENEFKNLHELAECYPGQLKTKNIEL